MMDTATISLISSILLFLGTLIVQVVNRKNVRPDMLSKLEDTVNKAQERAEKWLDEKVACELEKDKLRGDLALALVKVADLERELANKNGYIQGITNPLIKLEQKQMEELKGGRRVTDK